MTARNRVVREPYATWCGRTPVELIHGLLPDFARRKPEGLRPEVRKLRFAHEEDVDRSGAAAALAHGAHDERLRV